MLSSSPSSAVLRFACAAGVALGLADDELAALLGVSAVAVVRELAEQAEVRVLVRRLEDAAEQRISRGAGGIVQKARQEAPAAFDRIVEISVQARDVRTAHRANLDVLAIAGVQAAKKVIVEHRDAALQDFTHEELEDFARTGQWPARLLTLDVTNGRQP